MPMNVAKVLGVDPGLKGAFAFLSLGGDLIEVEDMPYVGKEVNAHLIARLILGYGPVRHAIVERAQPMPKQGISGTFNYGTGYGKILGVLAALDIPIIHMPSGWKTKMHLGKDKNMSRQRASERWPYAADYFKRVKDDGRAEAALMAAHWLELNPQGRRVIRR
jgi:crossover junction endodeoxyribonuclease RuvC